ncbi:hypothetical protein PARPLA_00884 [Rhodobacteraceae bacterium THAF1]|uniref:hypothetical protein n=1 Tax=Palleronia sp. THAF1 TaxID=2587842 RepID=UPI000F3FFF3D|nr:hypothetical protein [Palleronia sp. THAF1]QFU07172.1 hypothetical protein FIU81_00605 [Palleronia sp. THAF1]VDC19991.1 hypothetical protein PARPLA_00884 [Rhodobacteraceae bacterium THAF1]
MQGFQFGHIETWSRSGVAKNNGNTSKVRRNGQRGWTPEQIIAEAAREPEASQHVGYIRRAPVVIAGTCETFDDLRTAHDEACNTKIAVPYTNAKTKKKSTRRRSIRVDTHTLYTSVVSLPVESAEALRDSKKMAECRRAFDLVIGFEKSRLEDAGGEFAMAVIHLDERQVHMHIFGLDRQRGSVNGLHPGKAAQDAFRARHGTLSQAGTNLFEKSKRAYCEAMREWQNDLHRDGLGKVGLCRFGPRRFRYSRPQWSKRKREEEESAQAQVKIRDLRKVRAAQVAASEEMTIREENVVEMHEALDSERETLRAQRRVLDRKESRLDAGIATVEAFADGLLEVHGDDKDGEVGPTRRAKRELSRWEELNARLKLAPKEVLRVGRRIGGSLRRLREEAAEHGRADAMSAARNEIEERFPKLGAIRAFALSLVRKLPNSEERQEATEQLDRVVRGESNDVNRFRSEESRSGKNGDPVET